MQWLDELTMQQQPSSSYLATHSLQRHMRFAPPTTSYGKFLVFKPAWENDVSSTSRDVSSPTSNVSSWTISIQFGVAHSFASTHFDHEDSNKAGGISGYRMLGPHSMRNRIAGFEAFDQLVPEVTKSMIRWAFVYTSLLHASSPYGLHGHPWLCVILHFLILSFVKIIFSTPFCKWFSKFWSLNNFKSPHFLSLEFLGPKNLISSNKIGCHLLFGKPFYHIYQDFENVLK